MSSMTPAPELNKPKQVLKPCPFCGGKAEQRKTNLFDAMVGCPPEYTILCKKCGASIEGGKPLEKAIKAWNRREG